MNKRAVNSKIYIVSYPKSGRTWLRLLIGRYLTLSYNIKEKYILETEKLTKMCNLPITSFIHDGTAMKEENDGGGCHYLDLEKDKSFFKDRSVILIGRDFKDTIVSAYFQAVKREYTYDGPISDFIKDERFGIKKILEFYKIWSENIDTPKRFMFITYEEMHQDIKTVLKNVLEFLRIENVNKELLDQSIDYCNFKNMQKMEKENKFGNKVFKPTDKSDTESYKTRKGKVGGYIEYLSIDDIEYINKVVGDFNFDVFERKRISKNGTQIS